MPQKKIVLLVMSLLLCVGAGSVAYVPDKTVAALSPRWAASPSQFITIEGMQVHLRDEGVRDDPQPIVLLHGTSASLHTWEGWVSHLKTQRRVISFDLPAFGLTGPFPDNDYRIEHYTQFVQQVTTHLGIKEYVLAGNSLGGHIAWHVALASPQQVKKLILVDAAGYPFTPKSIPIGFRIAQIPVLNKVMEYTLPRHMVDASVRNVYADPNKVSTDLVDRYYDLTLREGNRRALVERFKQVSADNSDAIKTISQPTLILWGKQDQLIPVELANKFHQDIQGSQLLVLDGLGHVPHEEDPQQTVKAVIDFLAL
ncbi:alpha/beta fold hydrolase [Agitococcus lubricus]|nr:alpha/beta hydrolase [Agitococcus lubricus]